MIRIKPAQERNLKKLWVEFISPSWQKFSCCAKKSQDWLLLWAVIDRLKLTNSCQWTLPSCTWLFGGRQPITSWQNREISFNEPGIMPLNDIQTFYLILKINFMFSVFQHNPHFDNNKLTIKQNRGCRPHFWPIFARKWSGNKQKRDQSNVLQLNWRPHVCRLPANLNNFFFYENHHLSPFVTSLFIALFYTLLVLINEKLEIRL